MPRLITLSRAARLVGVKRGALQQKIQQGELRTFEGELLLADLLRAYPQTQVEDTTMLERVGHIMEQAVNKIVRTEDDLPDSNTLATRILALGRELAQARQEARRYRELVGDLQQKLAELAGSAPGEQSLGRLQDWLQQALAATGAGEDDSRFIANEAFLRVMAAQVRILPSGHEFFIEGSDSILEAGLRSGLALDYGCSNGNCGLCKAKVVSGQVGKVREYDHVLSETEKGLGYILTCAYTAVTDVVLVAEEAGGSHDIPLQELDIRVKKVETPDEHVTLLLARTPRTRRLRFLAGQYLTLEIPGLETRDCAIASCPCDDMNLQFHVPASPADPFSAQMRECLRNGSAIRIRGPRGDFVLDEESPRSLVFIACDAGFGPVKSLVEHAMALDAAEQIHLCWITTRGHSHYAENLCRAWEDALDNFHYTALAAGADAATEALRRQFLPLLGADAGRFDFYVCMPEAMLDSARTTLTGSGIPAAQLRLEPLRGAGLQAT